MKKTPTKKEPAKKAATPVVALPTEPKKQVYTLEIYITSGPMSERFMKKNRVLGRTIQMRGDQTLENLHEAIFDAFDREEEHLYEFQIGGRGPQDPQASRYSLGSLDDAELDGAVETTTLASLELKVNSPFGYWFDFGDDWWHQVNLIALEAAEPGARYPKVIKRVGPSPPQYVDWDEEE
jgi:Plasmid pRiA4b ORF-3-like protein